MTELGYASTNFEAYRVTLLDLVGNYVPSSTGLFVCDDGISLSTAFVNQDGTVYQQRAGSSAFCVNRTGATSQTGATVTVAICRWQPALMGLLMGGKLARDNSDNIIGWSMPDPSELSDRRICLEAWTLAVDGENQAAYQGSPVYQHHVFPSVSWVVDDFSFGDQVNVLGLVGTVSPNPNIGQGPFDDFPDFVSDESFTTSPTGPWAMFLDANPPTALCQASGFTPGPPLLNEFDLLLRASEV